jgi:hypothetical protein
MQRHGGLMREMRREFSWRVDRPGAFEKQPEMVKPMLSIERAGRVSQVRFNLWSGHCTTAAACPFCATGLNRSRGRALRRAAWPCQQWMERWERLT